MKKTPIAIAILAIILAFTSMDYAMNVKREKSKAVTVETQESPFPNLTQKLIDSSPATLDYKITKRNRTTLLFDHIDITQLKDLRIYRNVVTKDEKELIVINEVQGAENQGGIAYLNLKLAFRDQIDATQNLNEVNDYGHNSFYFNDLNQENTAFLLVRIGDNMFGFQYRKDSEASFKTIKAMISALMAEFNS